MSTQLDIKDICKFKPLSNLDDNANVFFQKELESIIPELFYVDYAEFSARNLFPIDKSAGPGAETITYTQYDGTGMAKIIADYASDIPLVNTKGKRFTGNVRTLASKVKWSDQELRAALMARKPLDTMLAKEARNAILRLESQIAFNGDADHGLLGLFSDPNIPKAAAPLGGGGFTEWSTKTPAEILQDMYLATHQIVEVTNGVERPDTMVMPIEQYNLIKSTNAGLQDSKSILTTYLENNGFVTNVMGIVEMKEAVDSDDVLLVYKKDPSKIRLQVPLDLEQKAPQEIELWVQVIYFMRTGGLTIPKPLSLNIMTGI